MDANEHALNRYLTQQEESDRELENFEEEARARLEELFVWASNYEDKDYTDEMIRIIHEG
jgi:hypothetical protein